MHLRTDILKNQAQGVAIEKSSLDPMTLLLYSNIIQQNISYTSNLELRILSLNQEKINLQKKLDEINLAILALKNEIANLKQQRDQTLEKEKAMYLADLEKLKIKKENIRAFDVVQPPVASLKPVKPKKALVLAVAMVSGMFLGIFLVFILHAYENRRAKA